MSIFSKRTAFKPFEYPETERYRDAITHSDWLVTEWSFVSDVHEFRAVLDDPQRSAIKNSLLAISQIEVDVKKFWRNLGDRFQKPEFDQVGVTFAESEVRHANAYSHLLEVLNLNNDFDMLLQNPVIGDRVEYLTKYLKGAAANSNQGYTMILTLFSIFIENVSLFSQFLVIKAFNKHLNVLKDIDNVVQATQKEEAIHALFGVYLIHEIKKEFPEWFDEAFYEKIYRACRKAYDAECKIIDWIFENGDLAFITADQVKEFTKQRFNESVVMIGGSEVFDIDDELILPSMWFIEELHADVATDFFHKKPVTYSKKVRSITAEDLF